MLVYWTHEPTSSSVSLCLASVTENRLNDSNLLTDTCRRQSSRCFCFRTCRKSFHRAAPTDAGTSGPRAEAPLAGSSAAAHSASPTSAREPRNSIWLKSPIAPAAASVALSCQDIPTSSLPGPVAPRLPPTAGARPEFRISGIRVSLATKAALLVSLHHFYGGHLE